MDIGGISGGIGPSKGPGPLVVAKGDILKALIVEILSENKAVLELAGRTMTVNTAFSLSGMEGKTVLLKSLGSGPSGELALQLAGEAADPAPVPSQMESAIGELQSSLEAGGETDSLLGKLENLLLKAFTAGDTLTAADKSALGSMLVKVLSSGGPGFTEKLSALLSMTDAAANDAPGNAESAGQKLFSAIADLFPPPPATEQADAFLNLTGTSLEKAVAGSGILLESKLLANLTKTPADASTNSKNAAAAGAKEISGNDLKALLLKLKAALGNEGQTGPKDMKAVDGLLKDMRAFQFISKLTGSLYTFLPVKWDGLKDGRIAFKADGQSGGSCLINLDLEGLGKIAVSVFMRGAGFYVTLKIENPSFRDVIDGAAKDALKGAFSGKGLSLMTVNVTGYEESPKNHLEFPGGGHLISIKL